MRNFSVTIEVIDLYELSWKRAHKEFDQREGEYWSYTRETKNFMKETEARDHKKTLDKTGMVSEFELVRITKLDI